MSQPELAQRLHVGRTYLSQVEGGRIPSAAFVELFSMIERSHAGQFPIESEIQKTPIESELRAPRLRDDPPNLTPRERLKAARIAKGYTVPEFAKAVGYKTVSVYQEIEDGMSKMGEKMAIKAAKILGLDVEDLMEGSEEPPSRDGYYGTMGAVPQIGLEPGMSAKYIPLLSMAQCGEMMAWDDTGYTQQGFLVVNCTDPKAFAVVLSGDSMKERYQPGDVATVYPSKEPRNGGLVIAKLAERDGEGVFFKEYHAKGDKITLISYNPDYKPKEFKRDQFAWIYPVGKVTHNLL